jgi:hypothetical protein
MEQTKLLKELIHQIKDNKSSLAIVEMQLGPAALMVVRTTRPELMMRLRTRYHWKVQQKRT